LLYLPRLYVYHAETTDQTGHDRFLVMERKLFIIMTIAAVLASVFGIWMMLLVPAFLQYGWMQVKLGLYLILVIYHLWCWKINQDFRNTRNTRSHVWFRWFNEMPAIILILVVIMVIVRPF